MAKKLKNKEMDAESAKKLLWEAGELSWKLNDVQKKLKETVENDLTKTSVIVVSRRIGKTYFLVTEALSQCLKKPNSIVKFLFPQQKDAKTNILPLVRMITEDCPKHLKPIFNTQDKVFNFHNGSQMQLAGSLNIENIRGGFADLCIVDEAGYVSDLKYAIRSVLSPTIRTTGGRIIMASTPSKSPDHEFITEFMIPYKAAGRLKVFTIYDNPNFTPEIIQEIIDDDPLGVDSPDFKREYLCEIAIDKEKAVCPEFSIKKDDIIVGDIDLPDYTNFYVGADIGFRDLTVVLFGYYDFKEACLYVMDELVMNGPSMTTETLAENIKLKERTNFYMDKRVQKPYLRVMDVDLKLINDLNRIHDINFIATRKDNREGAINEMRMWIGQGRVKIHERCLHLAYHLEYGQWNNARSDFKRLSDMVGSEVKGGHVDAIPALYYLIRNINTSKNPYPNGYDMTITENTHVSNSYKKKNKSKGAEVMSKIFGKKRF